MNTARSGQKRRIMALKAEEERLDELGSALAWEEDRLDHAIRGEEVPRPTNFKDARAAAEARFNYIAAEDQFASDPELKAAEDWALIDSWSEAGDETPASTPDPGVGAGLTDSLEQSLRPGS